MNQKFTEKVSYIADETGLRDYTVSRVLRAAEGYDKE